MMTSPSATSAASNSPKGDKALRLALLEADIKKLQYKSQIKQAIRKEVKADMERNKREINSQMA